MRVSSFKAATWTKDACFFIPGLLLQNSDGPTQSIDGFRVVLVQDIVIVLFDFANIGRSFDVAFPDGDVLVEPSDLLCEQGGLSCVRLNVSLQCVDLLIGLRNSASLLDAGVITELLVGSELHLLIVLLLLTFLKHALHQLDDFLHWRYLRLCSTYTMCRQAKQDKRESRHGYSISSLQ